jgi:hypothetical protein
MRRFAVLAVIGAIAVAAFGCGDSKSEPTNTPAQAGAELRQDHRQAARHHARMLVRRQAAGRRARAAAHHRDVRRTHLRIHRQRQAEARRIRREEREVEEAEQVGEVPAEESNDCDPNYAGACLSPTASDYDCEGGSGNGPEYTGTVTVVGEDHYGLDSDGDGVGCE